jgi:excisionase family DNA binding protein
MVEITVYTPREAAKILRTSYINVLKLMQSGQLNHYREGHKYKTTPEAIQNYLKNKLAKKED